LSIREATEMRELEQLSPFAAKSTLTKGRMTPITPCSIRTAFQRDRDRLIHSKSFRRLQFKTQVFLSPEGDHYRTRLTHTLEVAQIARTISRALLLNEDLTEAIALGHDLGHTPFGHIGERTLSRLTADGFRHNEQSLRVVEHLEGKNGLNLTMEVRDGILCHSGDQAPATLEGCVVAKADRIAYINHDIDDAMRAGLIREFELPRGCIKVLGSTHGERINTMIDDMVSSSIDKPEISATAEVQQATDELRAFLFERVYQDKWRSDEEEKCDFVLTRLFDHFTKNPGDMPLEFVTSAYLEGTERAVIDYIASMTDRFAMRVFHEIFVPTTFSVI
jgi:dGTPase